MIWIQVASETLSWKNVKKTLNKIKPAVLSNEFFLRSISLSSFSLNILIIPVIKGKVWHHFESFGNLLNLLNGFLGKKIV